MAELTLRHARQIIEATFAKGREMGLKPLTVIVVDAGGHVKAFERADDTAPGRFGIAHGKAHGAIMMGAGGRALMKRAEDQAYFIAAVNGVFGGALVPVPGGILIRDSEGAIRGAVGVTGDTSDNDAEAGLAGIEAAGLTGEA
ncbi:GlcG/HbpS family heme-binding protein [Jannaschia rubra]|uniref:GlcG protein n=1 Tax=Jannaschia rubra TaxID=282197 RepID=A0A0M6XQE4_9RHOB|nr:heme-binding protein [Jannaschia rubra]CTQ32902.1 hypothetical protein JAN5088_01676 [Jannaschia rubra]SFG28036.1 Uncharacterized conserved protein GlcG, DUF336 family [Jannaschia rubra]